MDKKALENLLYTVEANTCAICELLSAVSTQALESTKKALVDDNACYHWINEHYDIVKAAVYSSEQMADSAQNAIEAAYMRVHFDEVSAAPEPIHKIGGPLDVVGMVNDALADVDTIRMLLGSIEYTGCHFRELCSASKNIPAETANDIAEEMQHFSAITDDYRKKVEATLKEILSAVKG